MTRRQFLNDLYRRLDALSREEAEEHLTYYAEMLADRMEEGMTEAEAVASMEDVDTIARRILGEREETAAAAPTEPAVPEAAPVKRRRRWVAPVVIAALALVALSAAVVAGLAAFNMVEGISDGIRIRTDDGAISIDRSGLRIEDEGTLVTVGPGGIDIGERVDGAPADSIAWEVDPTGIREIEVDWPAGSVLVENWEGNVIRLTERFDGALSSNEKDRFVYRVDGGELKISFDSRKNRSASLNKELVVQLPAGYELGDLEIESASADVTVTAAVGEAKVATAAGAIRVNCTTELRDLEAATASGDVHLLLEQDMPFSLEFGTAVGKLNHNLSDLEMTREGCSRGRGGAELEVATASGDIYLESN